MAAASISVGDLQANPGSGQSEAINPIGFGNTIINHGTIFSNTSAAIWLQNNTSPDVYGPDSNAGNVNLQDAPEAAIDGRTAFAGNFATIIYNYGTITAQVGQGPNAPLGQAIGQSANNHDTLFVNEVGATVNGNVTMGGADDTVALFTASTITGALNGGGGSNTLVLDAVDDPTLRVGELNGALTNFQTLQKLGDGEWVITGAITASTPGGVTATVEEGTLTLTGANTNFTGTMTVFDGAVLQIGRITSEGLTSAGTLTTNDGTTGSFTAPIDDEAGGTVAFNRSDNSLTQPSGAISGEGQVGQIGTGVLILTDNNTYTGGTFINSGTLNVSSDSPTSTSNQLGGPNGSLTFNEPAPINTIPNTGSPATFQFGASFNLNPSRAITIDAPNSTFDTGTFDTQQFTSTITQGITGAGMLIKIGHGPLTRIAGGTESASGALILNGQNTYTGGTMVQQGTLVVGDFEHGVFTPSLGTNPTPASLSTSGTITVSPGATLGGFGNAAGMVVNNGTVTAGNATPGFKTAGSYADGGAPVAASDALDVGGESLTPASVFEVGGLQNNAVVNLASDPTLVGNVLRVNGNYNAGPSATLFVNTVLNAGGPLSNQTTDRLLVSGNATGSTTTVHVNGIGAGAATGPTGVPNNSEGISIVQDGGSSTQGAFKLAGPVGNTAFVYSLNAYGPTSTNGAANQSQSVLPPSASDPLTWDYRLQNNYVDPSGPLSPPVESPGPPDARPQVQTQVPAYLSAARGLFQAGLLDIGTLHQRLGEIRDDQTFDRQGMGEVFIRAYGGLFNYTPNRGFSNFGFNFNEDYAAVQFGGNYNAINNEYGTLRVGLAGAIGRMWLQPSAIDGMSKALFNTQNFFGIATWQDRSGWYVDGIVFGGLFDGRFTTPQAGQTTGMNGTAVGASIESGIPFALPYDLSFEPQGQIVWQHLNFQNRTDVNGIDVDLGSPDQVTARVGFRLKRPFQTENGMLFTPYLKANLLQGIGGSSDVVLSGVAFGTGNVGTALQVGAGATGTLTRNLSLYGDVSWQSQVGNGGGFRGWIFNGGLRWLFGQPPAPPPGPVAVAAPAPVAARSYLVFFDWDKATLTGRARQIIREAAENSTRVQYTRIEVNGHTDTSGTPSYNMGLSLRRAHAVAGELVRDGVPANAISIRGFGQTDLLVATGPGVREPQNRRVEIIMR